MAQGQTVRPHRGVVGGACKETGKKMPDFEINEGYAEAGRRRADAPLSGRGSEDRVPTDGY